MKRTLWLVLVAFAAACGNVDTGSDTRVTPGGGGLVVTGSLPLSATQFAAVSGSATCVLSRASTGIAYAAVTGSDLSGKCADLQQGLSKPDARSVDLVVVRVDATNTGGAVTAGSYPVVATPGSQTAFALLQVSQNDAHCATGAVVAIGGTVQLTSVAAGQIQGTIDALLPDGGTISGAFDAPACAVTLGDVCSGRIGLATSTCAP